LVDVQRHITLWYQQLMAPIWKVVGGADKGGILVREECAGSSILFSERLSTGARIEEVELVGDRLHYDKIAGAGPSEGWVSIKISGKDLCIREAEPPADHGGQGLSPPDVPKETPGMPIRPPQSKEPPVPPNAPACLQAGKVTAPAFSSSSVLPPVIKYNTMKKLVEATEKRLTGDMYGLLFPQTPEEMLADDKFGIGWLTKAFHAAGSLPKDNSVKRIVSWKRFEGGGSGPKARFEVEYEKPDDALDNVLFSKMPWTLAESAQQRFVQEGQLKFGDNWGGEISFYRFISPSIPFAVPKLYFGDLSRESTEAVLINACVDWPEPGKTDFSPYEVFPPCGKCEDYVLTNPQDYYFAIMRRMGTFSGLAKANKLGQFCNKINWFDCSPTNDVNCAAAMPRAHVGARAFVEHVAPHWFPAKAKEKAVLDKFETKSELVDKHFRMLVEFIYADPLYVGLCHQNGNTDNCYFYKREGDIIEAGVLDWGSTCSMSYGSGFMGSTISALAEMLIEYDVGMVHVWADAYHSTGAPKLNVDELLLRYRVATCLNAQAIYSQAAMYSSDKALPTSKAQFAELPTFNCEEIRKNFGMKFGLSMTYNRIALFLLKGDSYWRAMEEVVRRQQK